MILNNEQLRQEAHNLALSHDLHISKRSSKYAVQQVDQDISFLRDYLNIIQDDRSKFRMSAEEWLLDHAEFIEEQVWVIQNELSDTPFSKLPHLKKAGTLRAYALCEQYVEYMDGNLDEASFITFIQAYQEVSVLTMSEIWTIPLLLRIALVHKLTVTMTAVFEHRQSYVSAEKVLSRVASSRITPESVNVAIDEEGMEQPLSGIVIVQLVKQLRERAADTTVVREWLICKLENGAESLDRILTYEYQLQASFQTTTGHIISSLRTLSRWDWNSSFEEISVVEQTLRLEVTGDYQQLDFSSREVLRKSVEQLAWRLRVPENLIAEHAVELAADAKNLNPDTSEIKRKQFAAYYLLESNGKLALRQALKSCSKPKAMPEAGLMKRPVAAYINLLIVVSTAIFIGFLFWLGVGEWFTLLEWILIGATLLFPAIEWAVNVLHWFIERIRRPVPLLRYDFAQGVPVDASTMVVIPVIWSDVDEVEQLVERLELHYLANRDSHIHFALLGDFADADQETVPEDAIVLATAQAGIERLNKSYKGTTFHLLQRHRQWNDSEQRWIGWERKRGKLVEFVELLQGSKITSQQVVIGEPTVYEQIRYIITLDADTQLPLESAHRLIGTIHLPYNRPILNESKSRVIHGYGVLQPKISMTHEAAMRSRLAKLWAVDPGVDPYAFAMSDPYQDGVGQGIFTGKGIFDVEAFQHTLCERIPENRVLSHDLLEGSFLRAGLLNDIELIDDHPATFNMHQKRQHRWIRGDWQLLLWLLPKAKNRRGKLLPVNLSILTRWQIIDNLRRSLLAPVLFFTLLLSFVVLPGSAERWISIVLLTFMIPIFKQFTSIKGWNSRSILAGFGQVFVQVITLPFQTVVHLDAILRTLYRLWFSKRKLLEWVTSAEVERSSGAPTLYGMFGGYVLIALFSLTALWSSPVGSALQVLSVFLILLWSSAPFIVQWLDQPIQTAKNQFSEVEKEELQELSKDIWSFYNDYVSAEDHWLPPDNVQIDPPNGIAHRTSPTNIGMYLSCALAAKDFGFIDSTNLIERLERTLDSIEKLEKWEGHLYNWYDTTTLQPLPPIYVSTVDSGNFVACLMTVKEGLAEWLEEYTEEEVSKTSPLSQEDMRVAFAEEITPVASRQRKGQHSGSRHIRDRGDQLIRRLEKLIHQTNFRPLYDEKSKLFSLGYHVTLQERDQILYDLMASEARQASFIAIALGQVSVSHWHALGRTMTRAGKKPVLLSWSGTMFEYLMPWLMMRTYHNTVWDSTYRAVVQRQIDYAKSRGVPFGISESGYYAFDLQMNYQYRAFGVPGLGFKRGLEQDLVVSSYATILALPFAKREGFDALRKLKELGGKGKYGYYEAVDFTLERMPKNRQYMVIRSFMAHHQGMSMLTLANLLLERNMLTRFHRDKQVKAAELLLQERIPRNPKVIKHPSMHKVHQPFTRPDNDISVREFTSVDSRVPEVCVLSNGAFSTVITNSGSGFSRFEGLSVTRWREDPIVDPWGSYIYIRDVMEDTIWSPSFQPCRKPSSKERVQFSFDRALFMREDEELQSSMEVTVSSEWNAEIRRITLTNTSKEAKIIEVTSFLELALANSIADDAHPAFSKLFIRTDFDKEAECLVASRRPREEKERTLWSAHSLWIHEEKLGPPEFDTDRSTFIGRGHTLAAPKGIRTKLAGHIGSVADPAFVMRRRISIEPGERIQCFAVTSAADTREEAVSILARFQTEQLVDRTFQLAWNRTQIELKNLHLTSRDAMQLQKLAGQVLYTPPFRKEKKPYIRGNQKGQSGLWAFGVSGDRPMMLVTIDSRDQMAFVIKLIIGHEYIRRLGIAFDLVILNESIGGYHQDLQEAIQRAVEQGVDRYGAESTGIQVIPVDQLTEDDRTLLFATARIAFKAGGPSIAAQMRISKKTEKLPSELIPETSVKRSEETVGAVFADEMKGLQFNNGWGGFSPDGQEYRMLIKQDHHLPAPWINVVANPEFGFIISELGTGYTWWNNSRECKLTPWSNDPILDPPAETGYLRDEETGEVWTLTPSSSDFDQPYQVTHGRGYSNFKHMSHSIKHELTLSVPEEDPVKIMELKLTNTTSELRKLSVTYYVEWVLGVNRQANAPYIVTEWNEEAQMMTAKNTYQESFRNATAFLGIYPQEDGITGSAANISWTADRLEFIGRNGSIHEPDALKRAHLSGRTGELYENCGAVQVKLELEPDSERTVYILLGCTDSEPAAQRLAQIYSRHSISRKSMDQTRQYWKELLAQTEVSTPSPEMDIMLNGWLIYQALACRMWARSAFFQAGGAFGFRDQLQDSLSMLHARPDLTKAQIILNASHQYEEGDVQHWWHVETEKGIRTMFSDDLLWLPYAVSRYIEHTGDDSILDERAPFIHSEPLDEGEHERYEPTVRSSEKGSIFDHCCRAIDMALSRIGEHGLPLIGVGDWNDGMNLVGAEGRGESVWLGWFLCDVLKRFAECCRTRGESAREQQYLERREQFTVALREHAWDGQWYRRAFTDSGNWLGSVHNEECRIDAIAQSWSVISGASSEDRSQQAMQSLDRELVDRELSLVRLLTPPFDRTTPSPGYIQGYPPGLRENGAQYTHGVIWSIVAWSMLNRGDKAMEIFHMLNPITHTRTDHEVKRYTGEPYVMAADVYTASPHEGHAGWTWYTGASGWMYQAGLEWILGIRRRGERLIISPRIPADWPEFSVNYRFGNTHYFISVENKSCTSREPTRLIVDGHEIDLKAPDMQDTPYIKLQDDGKKHNVTLTL